METVEPSKLTGLYHYYPSGVTLVSVAGKPWDNVMSAAWHTPISMIPPLYGVAVAPKRYSHELILKEKEYALNFLPFEKAETIAEAGAVSGREVDKFKKFAIAKASAKLVKAPILADAYAAFECHLVDQRTYGDHTLFVGEIILVHYKKDCFTPQGTPDLRYFKPALYLGKDLYVTANPEPSRFLDREHYRS